MQGVKHNIMKINAEHWMLINYLSSFHLTLSAWYHLFRCCKWLHDNAIHAKLTDEAHSISMINAQGDADIIVLDATLLLARTCCCYGNEMRSQASYAHCAACAVCGSLIGQCWRYRKPVNLYSARRQIAALDSVDPIRLPRIRSDTRLFAGCHDAPPWVRVWRECQRNGQGNHGVS